LGVIFMKKIKDEINWENFLDNFFNLYNVTVEKKAYFGGLTVNYKNDEIYVRCELENDRQKIKKLEFGRLNEGWIKGVFVNDERPHVTFLQESYDGENGEKYIIDYSTGNKDIICKFLQIPCELGWTETEFKLDEAKYYKVIVTLENYRTWEISLMDFAQQDLPLLGDKLDVWANVKLGDAFWNKSRRHSIEKKVLPLSGLKKTNAQQCI
jgi:hypothetical protein